MRLKAFCEVLTPGIPYYLHAQVGKKATGEKNRCTVRVVKRKDGSERAGEEDVRTEALLPLLLLLHPPTHISVRSVPSVRAVRLSAGLGRGLPQLSTGSSRKWEEGK